MIEVLQRVALTEYLPSHGLKEGDVATVLMVHGDHEGYEPVVCSPNGETVALA